MGPQKKKKMNKHFYMTPLKMKRKATFLYGFTKNESKENPITTVYGSTKNEMKKPFYMGPQKMKLKETFLYGPHLNESECLNIYNIYQKQ